MRNQARNREVRIKTREGKEVRDQVRKVEISIIGAQAKESSYLHAYYEGTSPATSFPVSSPSSQSVRVVTEKTGKTGGREGSSSQNS